MIFILKLNIKPNSNIELLNLLKKIVRIFCILCLSLLLFIGYIHSQNTIGSQKEIEQVNTSNRESTIIPQNVVSFSKDGGFYSNNINLLLNQNSPDAIILYTTDGSQPNPQSLNGLTYSFKQNFFDSIFLNEKYQSYKYKKAIKIKKDKKSNDRLTQKSSTIYAADYFPNKNVFKGVIIRAGAFINGEQIGNSKTQTYFITEEGRDKYKLPVIALSIEDKYLYDFRLGIYNAGEIAQKWFTTTTNKNIPYWHMPANYWKTGRENEIIGNLEFFPINEKHAALNQKVGIRLHGGIGSKFSPNKSFRLYARNSYGNKNFNYDFFNSGKNTEHKRLILRNSGDDNGESLIRDICIQNIAQDMNIITQKSSQSVLFINGEFWGIYNLRERFDQHYFEQHFDIKEKQLDYISNQELKSGSRMHYDSTIQFIINNDITLDTNYEFIKKRIDIDNFIDYNIINIYANNWDWPGNNNEFFRNNSNTHYDTENTIHDGKWRWVLKDTDYGFDLYSPYLQKFHLQRFAFANNMMIHATAAGKQTWHNPDWSTFLLRNLLKNSNFRTDFLSRFEFHLEHTFSPDRVINIIDSLAGNIRPHIIEHFDRWTDNSVGKWHVNIDLMRHFANLRPCALKYMIVDYFAIEPNFFAKDICDCKESEISGDIRNLFILAVLNKEQEASRFIENIRYEKIVMPTDLFYYSSYLLHIGNLEQSKYFAEKLVNENQSTLIYRYLLLDIYYKYGLKDKLFELINDNLILFPNDEYSLTLKEIGIADYPIEIAIAKFQAKKFLIPDYLINLAILQFENALYNDCIETLLQAIEINPDFYLVYYNICAAYISLNLFEEACDYCSRAIILNPDYLAARNNLSYASSFLTVESKNYDKLIANVLNARKTAEEIPSDLNYLNLGFEYFNAGLYKHAIDANLNALKLNPELARAYNNLCIAYAELKEYDKAISACENALRINPDYERAKNNLEMLLQKQ